MNSTAPLSIAVRDRPSAVRIIWTSVLHDDALAASVLAALFATILTAIALMVFSEEARFLLRGVEGQGQVRGKHIAAREPETVVVATILAHGGGNRPRHVVDYEFTDAAGNSHQGQSAVPFERWNATSVGDAVKIVYLPHDPDTNRLVGAVAAPLALQFGLLIAACAAICICLRMLWLGVSHVRINLELFQAGEPTLASIDNVVNRAARKSREDRILHYSYRAPEPLSGRSQTFTGTCPGAGRRGKKARQGDTFLVCYDEHDPRRHAVDRYGLFPFEQKSATTGS